MHYILYKYCVTTIYYVNIQNIKYMPEYVYKYNTQE